MKKYRVLKFRNPPWDAESAEQSEPESLNLEDNNYQLALSVTADIAEVGWRSTAKKPKNDVKTPKYGNVPLEKDI